MNDLLEKLNSVSKTLEAAADEARAMTGRVARLSGINFDEARAFLSEPWCILPKSPQEWWVIVPRWVGLQVGWLERSTPTYNVFIVNRYAQWLGSVPEELEEHLKLPKPFDASIEDGLVRISAERAPAYRNHLSRKAGRDQFKIKKGHEFKLMAALIEDGAMPFKRSPVDPEDLRQVTLKGDIAELRDYQKQGWKAFLENGAVGIFWPYGQGKTVIGCHAIASLKGRKLIVVPTRTLVEQWEKRLREWVDFGLRQDVRIVTYNSWDKVRDEDWTLAIFDECHRLPANTFSRLASIRAKYRMGLSATPYREDGRTNYIFALTGLPVGVDWSKFLREGRIHAPEIEVRIVQGWIEKKRVTAAEVQATKGKTLVFCDSIDRGRELAARLECPHVHGGTKDRLKVVEDNDVVVISRVGDEGLSVPTLKKTIEVDFLGGSRRQEGQRVGRLFHATGKGEHLVLMTRVEFESFERRFLALEEKGFRVKVKGF